MVPSRWQRGVQGNRRRRSMGHDVAQQRPQRLTAHVGIFLRRVPCRREIDQSLRCNFLNGLIGTTCHLRELVACIAPAVNGGGRTDALIHTIEEQAHVERITALYIRQRPIAQIDSLTVLKLQPSLCNPIAQGWIAVCPAMRHLQLVGVAEVVFNTASPTDPGGYELENTLHRIPKDHRGDDGR
ncbi:hypothetical protein D3C80_1157790 [compost metagenome]